MPRSKYRELWRATPEICPSEPHSILVSIDIVVAGGRRRRHVGFLEMKSSNPLMTETGTYTMLLQDMSAINRKQFFEFGHVPSMPVADFNPWLILREALDEIAKRRKAQEGFRKEKPS